MGRKRRNFEIGARYHIVHRGNQQLRLFEHDADCRYYLGMLRALAWETGVRVGGFCLMSNHVHFLVVPERVKAISECFGRLHQRYSETLNIRRGRRGACWEGRFYAAKMDDLHAWNALRYVERNPVEAGMVEHATEWMWSSARYHCGMEKEWDFIDAEVRLGSVDADRWGKVLGEPLAESERQTIRWLVQEEGSKARDLLRQDPDAPDWGELSRRLGGGSAAARP